MHFPDHNIEAGDKYKLAFQEAQENWMSSSQQQLFISGSIFAKHDRSDDVAQKTPNRLILHETYNTQN